MKSVIRQGIKIKLIKPVKPFIRLIFQMAMLEIIDKPNTTTITIIPIKK